MPLAYGWLYKLNIFFWCLRHPHRHRSKKLQKGKIKRFFGNKVKINPIDIYISCMKKVHFVKKNWPKLQRENSWEFLFRIKSVLLLYSVFFHLKDVSIVSSDLLKRNRLYSDVNYLNSKTHAPKTFFFLSLISRHLFTFDWPKTW
jgi:hypothetical protein